jgi:hypothetical protein
MDWSKIVKPALTVVITATIVIVLIRASPSFSALQPGPEGGQTGSTTDAYVAQTEHAEQSPEPVEQSRLTAGSTEYAGLNEEREDTALLGAWVYADGSKTTNLYFSRHGTVKFGNEEFGYMTIPYDDVLHIMITNPNYVGPSQWEPAPPDADSRRMRHALFTPSEEGKGIFVLGEWNEGIRELDVSHGGGSRMLYRDPQEASRHAVRYMPTVY